MNGIAGLARDLAFMISVMFCVCVPICEPYRIKCVCYLEDMLAISNAMAFRWENAVMECGDFAFINIVRDLSTISSILNQLRRPERVSYV